jgi:L-fuconolactonase
MRIDAHVHLWRFDPVRDAWITPNMGVIRRDFLPADLEPLLRESGIDGVVAVQADQSETETRFLLDLAEQHVCIRGVVGWIDLTADDLAERLTAYRASPMLKGFRHIAQAEANDFLARPDIIRGVQTLGAHGYRYDVLIYPRQLAAAATLVAACPDVVFIVDHCAKPNIATGDFTTWRSGIAALAAHRHVHCKLSGLVTEAAWDRWQPHELTPVLDWALECFGADRLMFGSDWPVCLLAANYARVHEVVSTWAERLSKGERRAIFGDTAARVYRLDPTPSA